MVAAMYRADPREMPQTPWPLVQPFQITEPNPTNRPAATKSSSFFETTWTGAVPVTTIQSGFKK